MYRVSLESHKHTHTRERTHTPRETVMPCGHKSWTCWPSSSFLPPHPPISPSFAPLAQEDLSQLSHSAREHYIKSLLLCVGENHITVLIYVDYHQWCRLGTQPSLYVMRMKHHCSGRLWCAESRQMKTYVVARMWYSEAGCGLRSCGVKINARPISLQKLYTFKTRNYQKTCTHKEKEKLYLIIVITYIKLNCNCNYIHKIKLQGHYHKILNFVQRVKYNLFK